MEDISSWKEKFEVCIYAKRLLDKLEYLNTQVKNPVDLEEIKKGIYYARKYHGSQMRQSGEPYYSHPIEVAYMLAEYTAKDKEKYFRTNLLVVSILHDTIQDTELTFEMIQTIFDQKIATQVMDLTRIKENGDKISSAEMVKSLWLQKKYALLFIKQLDRLHNLQTIQAKSIDKIKKIVNETFNTFVVLAMGAQHKNLEKAIYDLCCKTLSIEMIEYEFSQTNANRSHLASVENTDIHRYLFQVFQNVIAPTKS